MGDQNKLGLLMEISINKRNRAICKRDPISPLNSPRIQTFNTVAYIFNIQITVLMLHCIQ